MAALANLKSISWMTDRAGDAFVVVVELEALGIELASDPPAHLLVLLVLWVAPGFEEVLVARGATDIFRRPGAAAGDAAGGI